MTLYRKGGASKYIVEGEPIDTMRIDLGQEVETKYASETNAIIYIQDAATDRFVAFKAFLNSFKLNIKPSIETTNSIFILDPFISRGQTTFSYSLSVDVPAANQKEARSNLAKMQELFRYIGTLGNRANPEKKGNMAMFDQAQVMSVYFANLINRGNYPAVAFPFSSTGGHGSDPNNVIQASGIEGIIKKIEYKPSIDTGFFEDENNESNNTIFLPKHYTLDIELTMITPHERLGQYWPFGVRIKDSVVGDD